MPKDKERTVNPAQAQRRLEKQKALKKGKAEAQSRRNEKLARRNPHRIQRQIEDLKASEEPGKPLKPQQKEILEGLERDLRAVNKAREALGDKAPVFGRGEGGPRYDRDKGHEHNVLGKRRREAQHGSRHWRQEESSGSETDESVRRIPMPKDTPPPIPRPHSQRRRGPNTAEAEGEDTATATGERKVHELPPKPQIAEAKSVYESAPVIRNLQKEAVNRFVPATVRMKQAAVKGEGQLVEPEEMDRLEKAGYAPAGVSSKVSSQMVDGRPTTAKAAVSSLEEEEERFNRELKSVQIEEVEDDGN